jgi:muramoyltetrapeptide carboxypeptidase
MKLGILFPSTALISQRPCWLLLAIHNCVVTKHIYIYSPSGAVRDKAAFKRGVQRLKALGHSVEVDADALKSSSRFAGVDEVRIAAIDRAAASGADVALISRGGYGLTRILDDIPYKRVAKAIESGTQFVGISDFTAFQMALYAKTQNITWAGPALCEGFGALPEPDDIMEDCFNDLIVGQGEGAGWRQSSGLGPADFKTSNAKLWGGNLCVLVSLLGTPYWPDISKGILFLEDIAEHPYRIERMLTQLLHAGVLANQKAIVLGQFTEYKLAPHDRGFNFNSVVSWLRSKVKAPVLTNLPYGHVQTKVLLPFGANCDLLCEGRDVLLAWGHIG